MPSDGTWPAEPIENGNHARKAARDRGPSASAVSWRVVPPRLGSRKQGRHPLRVSSPEIRSGVLERETGFEPATFCLGSPDLVSAVARA